MARRIRETATTVRPAEAEVTWAGMRDWSRRCIPACDPPLPSDGEYIVGHCEAWGMFKHLDGTDLTPAERVERLSEFLESRRWPWPPGESNPHGFQTFLDSAMRHVERYCRKHQPERTPDA